MINDNGILKIKKWTKAYSFDEILKAMDAAAEQYLVFEDGEATSESWEKAFNKIPSIIKVSQDSKTNPDLKDFFYIRGILRNRLHYYDPHLTLEWLKAARSWGASIDELKSIAAKTRNWTTFSDDIDELIAFYKKQGEPFDNSPEDIDDMPF